LTVWEAVTADELELPIAQADTLLELSDILETSYPSVKMRAFNEYSGRNIGFRIYKIEID
jgi:hypothetical protein